MVSFARHVRASLESAPDALSQPELLQLIEDFVVECSSSPSDQALAEADDELQDMVGACSLYQLELILLVLHQLSPVLASASIISNWFDLVLRPALREPKLPTQAVRHAKALILSTLPASGFQRRLFDLYLLDAYNDASSQDMLELAQLADIERERKACWKTSLDDVLLSFGLNQPNDFLTELDAHWATPSARLQLIQLLNAYTSLPTFSVAILSSHPLMESVLLSLQLDTSTTLSTVCLVVVCKLLPMMAVDAAHELKLLLPRLLSILSRILSWKDEEPPGHRRYFTYLYYLFPCNVISFTRAPGSYLLSHHLSGVIEDESELQERSEQLLRSHMYHPAGLIGHDADGELSAPSFWEGYGVARILSEAGMLDGGLAINQNNSTPRAAMPNLDDNDEAPDDHAISALQRQIILLRNELNIEVWVSKENAKHIGRLYQDRVVTKNVETERQALYNKLRNYRTDVIRLEAELAEHKQQASSTKNKYADWNNELQQKLREFREEKRRWEDEATHLRTREAQAQALFEAQKVLLAEATQSVFELQTHRKETQHKIDRLHDYERQIEGHLKLQKLWDADFKKFNERKDEMVAMVAEYKKMEMRVQSAEDSYAETMETVRQLRRQIQTIEGQAVRAERKKEQEQQMANVTVIDEFAGHKKAMRALVKENMDLREELEEFRAMVQVLRERRGLMSDPRDSPLLSPVA